MKYLSVILAILLVGCVAVPALDTYNKQRAAFEITYQEVLRSAISLREQGLIDTERQATISTALDKIEVVRSAADYAEGLGDFDLATDRLKLAQTLLLTLSDFLKKQADPNVKFNSSDRTLSFVA